MQRRRKETARGNASLFSWVTQNARSSVILLLSNSLLNPKSVCIHNRPFMDKTNSILMWDKCKLRPVRCTLTLRKRNSIPVQLLYQQSLQNHRLCRKDVWDGHVISQVRKTAIHRLINPKIRKSKITWLLNHPKPLLHTRFRCRLCDILSFFPLACKLRYL